MAEFYRHPVFEVADLSDSELSFLGFFVRSSLLTDGMAAIKYPALTGPIEVTFMAASKCPITLMARSDMDDKVIVAPLGLTTRAFHLSELPTTAEDCAAMFGCQVHQGADLANLMIAVKNGKEDHHADR